MAIFCIFGAILYSAFMNRIDRITAILIQLQSRKVVKAQDIADRFNISLRTVYRDVKTLEEAGIPVIGEAGVGYSIMDGYRLPPVMFTKEEATAFLTAEKFIGRYTDAAMGENYRSAMYKVRAVLRSAEKDMLENIEAFIEVMPQYGSGRNTAPDNVIETIIKGIGEKKQLRIHYKAATTQQATVRDLEPVGIFHLQGYWHMIAWCHMRNDYREFRADRVSRITLTDNGFTKAHPGLKEYLEKAYRKYELHEIVIQVHQSKAIYVGRQKYAMGFVSETEKGDYVEMTFLCPSVEGFARWYLMLADHSRIISPASMKDMVKRVLADISAAL
jgi:predicted DNA-binding transcriptional regulator YafY